MLLSSNRIRFTTTRPEDLDRVLALERDQYNSRYVFRWSREQHQGAMDAIDFLHITIKTSAGIIGYMILHTDSINRVVEFKRLVIGPKGQGYGREAVELLKQLAFEKLNCHRLWLDVYTDNVPAISLYLDLGFVQEGLLRDCQTTAHGYRSMLVMSMLEYEYNK